MADDQLRTSPLDAAHRALDAKMVPFGGWDMPLHYGSQIEEHHAVRRGAGVFDVSHMRAVDATWPGARAYLRRLLANDVAKLRVSGKALYSCMLDPRGGVVDDLIVYHLDESWFRVVLNAATTVKDLAWMRAEAAGVAVELRPRPDLAMLAVQGPKARGLVEPLLPGAFREPAAALKPFVAVAAGDWFVFTDKVNHFIAYFVLAVLVNLTLIYQRKSRFLFEKATVATIVIFLFYGAVDELHQMLVPGRFAETLDWVADA